MSMKVTVGNPTEARGKPVVRWTPGASPADLPWPVLTPEQTRNYMFGIWRPPQEPTP